MTKNKKNLLEKVVNLIETSSLGLFKKVKKGSLLDLEPDHYQLKTENLLIKFWKTHSSLDKSKEVVFYKISYSNDIIVKIVSTAGLDVVKKLDSISNWEEERIKYLIYLPELN